jgi:hypothetical protein
VRINPTNGFEPRPLTDAAAGLLRDGVVPASQQPEQADRGLVVERQHAAYIQKAAASDEVNQQAVEEARKMLESGQLDTPQAATRLADAILKFGL